ncbi:MAG: hypothetical protein KA712_05210 [Myxococcales bacterium]|nr:hypothetical protein [Myxococcales bacterium]
MKVYGWVAMGGLGVLLTGGGLVNARGDRKVKAKEERESAESSEARPLLNNDNVKRRIDVGEVVLLVLEE